MGTGDPHRNSTEVPGNLSVLKTGKQKALQTNGDVKGELSNLLKCHMYSRMLMPIHQPASHNTMPKASRECREAD